MNSLQDAIYNWLTIKAVAEARPDDTAAQETVEMFSDILLNDFKITDIEVTKGDIMYQVQYKDNGEQKNTRFPVELIDVMLEQIESEPEKYINYPEK